MGGETGFDPQQRLCSSFYNHRCVQPQREANNPELSLRFNSAQRITSATSYVFVVKMENKFKKRKKSVSKEISGSHGGEYDVQSCLLGYTAM
jgi:hypothetical protein